jgi:hypothetical protein
MAKSKKSKKPEDTTRRIHHDNPADGELGQKPVTEPPVDGPVKPADSPYAG